MNCTADSLGSRVRALRKRRGWTQEDLSKRAGCVTNTICRLENGQTRPTRLVIEAVARAFEVSPESLTAPQEGSKDSSHA